VNGPYRSPLAPREESEAALKRTPPQFSSDGDVAKTREPDANPWVKFAGMFKDEPMFAEVIQIMAEQRRKEDADPDFL
jgi:hypothetical protein